MFLKNDNIHKEIETKYGITSVVLRLYISLFYSYWSFCSIECTILFSIFNTITDIKETNNFYSSIFIVVKRKSSYKLNKIILISMV